MSVIIRLMGLSWSASAMDIRNFFTDLSIPPGGVRIIGGDNGDAFIAFSTDEDARQAMMFSSKLLNDCPVQLYLSSKTEMQNTITQAKDKTPTASTHAAPVANTTAPLLSQQIPSAQQISQAFPSVGQIMGTLGLQQPQSMQMNQYQSGYQSNIPQTTIQTASNFNNSNVDNTQTMPVVTKAQQVKDKNVSQFEQALPGEYSVGGIGGQNKLLEDNAASQRQYGYMDQSSYGSSSGEQRISYKINQTDALNQEIKPSQHAFGSNVSNDRFQGHDPYMQKTHFQSTNSNNQGYIGDHKQEMSNPQTLNQTDPNMPFRNQQMFKSQSDNFSPSHEKPYQSDLANINQDFGHRESYETDHNALESHQTFVGANQGYPPSNRPNEHNFAIGSHDANFPKWNRPDDQKFPPVSRPSDSSYQRNIPSSDSNIPPWSHLNESRMPPRDRQNDSNFPSSSRPSESYLPPNESVVMPPNNRLNDSKFSTAISHPRESNYPPTCRANDSTSFHPKTDPNNIKFPHFVSRGHTNESNFPPSSHPNEPPATSRRNDPSLKPSILSNKSPIALPRTRQGDTSFAPPVSHSSDSHMSSRGRQNDPHFVPIGPTRESNFALTSKSNESVKGALLNDPNIPSIGQPTDQHSSESQSKPTETRTVKPFQIRSKFGSQSSSTKSPTKPTEPRPVDPREKQHTGKLVQSHDQVSVSTSDKLKSGNNMPTVQSDVPAATVALSDKRDEFGRNVPYSGRDNMSDSSRTPTQDEKSDELNEGRAKESNENRSRESNEGRSKDSNRRSSRDRDRSRDRHGRRDSPRDRDRDRRDRDRDRSRRDRDDDRKSRRDRDRDRDRDRKHRDRDGDRYDRNREYKDGDKKNSPGNDASRKGRKRSLSPSSKNKNDTDKKMQIEIPGKSTISKSNDKTDMPKSLMGPMPPLITEVSLPAQAPPVLPAKDDKEKKFSTGIHPLLPVTAPSKSRGLLGESPNTLMIATMQGLNKFNQPPRSGPNFSGNNIADFKTDAPCGPGSGVATIPKDFRRQGFQARLSGSDPKLTPLINMNVPPPSLSSMPVGRPIAPGMRGMEAPPHTFEYGHSDEAIRKPGIDITQQGPQIYDKRHLQGPHIQRDEPMDIDEATDTSMIFEEPKGDMPPCQPDFTVPPPGMARLMMDFKPPGINTVAPDRQDAAQNTFKDPRPPMRDGHPPFVNRNQMEFKIPPGRGGNSGRGASIFNDHRPRDLMGPPPGRDGFTGRDGPPGSRQRPFDERNKRGVPVRSSLLGDGGPQTQFTDMAEFIDIADQAELHGDEELNDMNSRDFHGVPYRDEPNIDDGQYPHDFRNINRNARDRPRFGDRNALESRDVTHRDGPRGLFGDLPFENKVNFNRDDPRGRGGPPQDFRDRAQVDIGRERNFTDFHGPRMRGDRGYNSMDSSFRGQQDFDVGHPGDFRGPDMNQEQSNNGRFDSRRDTPFDNRGESDSRGPSIDDRPFYDRRPDSMRDIDMGQPTTRGVHREGDRNRDSRNINRDENSMDHERGGPLNREGHSTEREREESFHRDLPSSTDRERGGLLNRGASLAGRERSGTFNRDGQSTNDRERGGIFNREGSSTNERERGGTYDRRERYDNRSSDNRVNSSTSRNRPNDRSGDYRNREQFNDRNDRQSSRDDRKDSFKRESDDRRSSRFDDKSNERKSSTTNTRSNTDTKVNSAKENDSKKDTKIPTDKRSDSKIDEKAIANDIAKGTALCSVSLECIPVETTYKDIRKLFAGLELPKDGIKIINNTEGKRIGKAFIRFGSQESFKKGLQKDRTMLGNKTMVVKPVSRNEFDIAIDSYLPPSEDDDDDGESTDIDVCNSLSATLRALKGEAELKLPPKKNTTKITNEFVVKMTMLPDYVKATNIKTFFQGCQIARNGEAIVIESNRFNTCTGLCYAEFANEISFKRALNHRKVFDRKTIVISQGTKKEIEDCGAKMKKEIEKKSSDKVIDSKSTDDKAKSYSRNEKSMPNIENKLGITNIKPDTIESKLGTHVNTDNSEMKSVDEVISSIMNKDKHVTNTEASKAPPVCTCLRIRNIPKTMKVFELRGLFEGLGVTVKVAQICHDAVGKAIGEGYVEFITSTEVEKALVKNNTYIGKNKITVEPVTKIDMIENMRILRQSLQPEISTTQAVFYFVKAANLPKNVSTGEIMNFFSGYHPAPESIRLNIGDGIEPQDASTALVGFRTREEAETAISSINGNLLRSKNVVLNKVIL